MTWCPRPGHNTRHDDTHSKYERSRRTLILSPIVGGTEDEIIGSLQEFLGKYLLIPGGEVRRNQIELVRRYRGTRLAREKKEAIVVFCDNETRDFVLSHARNLVGQKDIGVRIDVPAHLLGIKRTFDDYAFVLKGEIGVGFKRNVRYEDLGETLVMDVFYPDSRRWERLSYQQALDGIANGRRVR